MFKEIRDMKIFKLTYGLMAAAMLSFVSCNINDYPEFDDSDAFVAIQSTTAAIAENAGKTLEIPVMLTSLNGLSGSVDFTIEPASTAGAVEGTNFKVVNSSKTLTYSADAAVQNIVIEPIDNDTFGGDVKFTITLTNPQGVNLGANKSCVVTIEDNEHPLAFILGDYTGKGEENWDGDVEWAARIEKDATDLNKVWITHFLPSCDGAVYGVVNAEKTTITIPLGQEIHPHSSYNIVLDGYHADTEARMESSESIVGKIDANGNISFDGYYMGAYAISKSTGTGAGWWTLVLDGTVLNKSN